MKRISMALASGLLAAGMGVAVAGPAAADYPPDENSISIAGCSDVKGGVKVKVKDMKKNTELTVSWTGPESGSVTTTTKSNGTASVTLPIKTAGFYEITVVGTDELGSEFIGTTSVTVLSSCSDNGATGGTGDTTGGATGGTGTSAGASGGLSDSGADSAALLAAGLGALVVGGGTVLISRRRRTAEAQTA